MQAISPIERTLTAQDHARLARLLAQPTAPGGAQALHDLLDASDIVAPAELAATVVSVGSRVLLQDPQRAAPAYELTLCWPDEARPGDGCISVLSPVGASLLGLAVGAVAHWSLPGGQEGAARVVAVLFQPEHHAEVTV